MQFLDHLALLLLSGLVILNRSGVTVLWIRSRLWFFLWLVLPPTFRRHERPRWLVLPLVLRLLSNLALLRILMLLRSGLAAILEALVLAFWRRVSIQMVQMAVRWRLLCLVVVFFMVLPFGSIVNSGGFRLTFRASLGLFRAFRLRLRLRLFLKAKTSAVGLRFLKIIVAWHCWMLKYCLMYFKCVRDSEPTRVASCL